LDVQRHQGAGIATYLAEYLAFFVRAAFRLARDHARRRYALVQVATLPDWLVFAALPLRLTGVPVILDLHEATPEFFASRFPGAANAVLRWLLQATERASIAAATHAVTVNDALRARLLGLGVAAERISIVPNSPSLARFDRAAYPARPFMADATLRLIFAGGLTPTYEVDVAVRAIAALRDRRPELPTALEIYGRGDSQPELERLVTQLDLADRVSLRGRIPIEDVPAAIARADVGLATTRLDSFTEASLSTKIFEYAAMGKPVVCARLPLVDRTFPPEAVRRYASGDPGSLADQIVALIDDAAARDAGIEAARTIVERHSWEHDAPAYLDLLERFARDR
ncbi:MAG TPA: glycosyltransferase, partial [Candidatus Eisenbacteria bacterium]|nr:glycosyltransferase [Candidatus Eisenbacteria bacterium]